MIARRACRAAALAIAAAAALASGAARAHPLAPALLSLEEGADGVVAVTWKVSRLRPTGSDVAPVLPAHCARLPGAPEIAVSELDVTERFRVDCGERGLVGARIAVAGLDRSRTDALLHVRLADGRSLRGLVSEREPTYVVPERESAGAVAHGYFGLGVEHLLTGLDHVLFVAGLVLLVPGGRRLVATITSFTLGHSVTLSLATLGVVEVPAMLFELLIAVSILLLGAELARRDVPPDGDAGVSWLRRRPWVMAFSFGLLHGLGFAGALAEIGLPHGDIPLALVAFNVGVEAGQLLIVAPLVALGYMAGPRMARLPDFVRRAPAYAIGSLAAYWCFERAVLFL